MSETTPKHKYRVTVIEWLSHTVLIEAEDRDEATEEARRLWLDKDVHDRFEFEDADLETVIADEID